MPNKFVNKPFSRRVKSVSVHQRNYFSGVECKDEIYAAHQLACVKAEIAATPEPLAHVPKVLTPPTIQVELVDDTDVNAKVVVDNSNPPSPAKTISPPKHRPISVTAKLFSSYEPPKEQQEVIARPHTATKTIFAPRTEDMSKGFLTFSEEEPGLTSKYFLIIWFMQQLFEVLSSVHSG